MQLASQTPSGARQHAPSDIAALVTEAAEVVPERLAFVEAAGRSHTWAQLDAEVDRIASGLSGAGLVAGQRALIALGNRLEFIVSYFAILRLQAVAVPVNPTSTVDELARMLADSGSRVAVGDAASIDALRAARDAVIAARADAGSSDLDPEIVGRAQTTLVVCVDTPPAEGEASYADLGADVAPPPPLPDPEKLAVLLYTSGTSGRPRAAMLTHRALLANIEQAAHVDPPMMHGDDVVLGVLPLFHVYGLNAVLGNAVRHRAKVVLQERFDPQGTLDLIEDEAISVVPIAPAVFPHWLGVDHLADRLGPVRLVLSGSAPLSAEVIERFVAETGVTVHQGYGLTEAAPVVTTTLGAPKPLDGSVGVALPGVDLRLVDEHDQTVEGDDPGEIQVRGANLFSGYWPEGSEGPDAEGWWSTGDVGFLDPDGNLVLVDRLKELIIVSGFNVYPHEVESVIREVDDVSEAAVIGVPDGVTGEQVVAYVVSAGGGADLESAVRARCELRLARFKQPSRVEVVDVLPHSVTGKVQKGRLRGLERRRSLELLEP